MSQDQDGRRLKNEKGDARKPKTIGALFKEIKVPAVPKPTKWSPDYYS